MKTLKCYLRVILGALIIGLALNLFFVGRELVPSGIFGFSILYSMKSEMNLAFVILLTNIFFLTLGYITIPSKYLSKTLCAAFLVPLFTFLTQDIVQLIDISEADFILIAIFGGVLIGIGQKFIYQQSKLASSSDVIDIISKRAFGLKGSIVNYILDCVWIIFSIKFFGFEQALYSVIVIVIIEMMRIHSTVGVSTAKVFYIITKEEAKVKKFIMDVLHYDLTIFDVKGGFSKTKNRVLMSAIPTKDYYRLREGIKEIDPNAFISITDSYELLNQDVTINKK